MPTGENEKVGFGWGAYRTPMGALIVARSNTPRSVSMTPANCDYYDSIEKGHKSAMVNRAMEAYRGAGLETHELLSNIAGLQQVIADLYAEKSLAVSSPMGGFRAFLAKMWPF